MMKDGYTLVLDAGTTAVKAFVFDSHDRIVAKAERVLTKSFPQTGWVEQNPTEIIDAAIQVMQEVVRQSQIPAPEFIGMGIATQRETIVAWDKTTSQLIYPAIVWQDVRTADWCKQVPAHDRELVQQKTGLSIDPYFSASKIKWILEHVPKARELVAQNQLAVGTIDSWIVWNIAHGSPYRTDYTNASRTLLFNIQTLKWDKRLLEVFGISESILPQPQPSHVSFGNLKKEILGFEIPILAVAGDQQASLYAAGTDVGTTKATYGTGTFVMQIVGSEFALHRPFFTTLAINPDHQPWYALEAKATSGVEDGAEILQNQTRLQAHLEFIVHSADAYIKQLPHQPTEIVMDGGWIRDGKMLPIQSRISSIAIREQDPYDGTALGIHRLITF